MSRPDFRNAIWGKQLNIRVLVFGVDKAIILEGVDRVEPELRSHDENNIILNQVPNGRRAEHTRWICIFTS